MAEDHAAQMNDALEQVRNVVGDEYDCGISDNDLKKALWDRYFDVHQGVNWVFGTTTFSVLRVSTECRLLLQRRKTVGLRLVIAKVSVE